jgi:two-component sensor histidine kinase
VTSQRYPCSPGSVAAARRFAADAVSDLPSEPRESIVLMVSELATNALLHAASTFELRIEQDSSSVTVVVTDEGGGTPRLRTPDSNQPHGRGLQVVSALATAWGTDDGGGEIGKSVWFRVDVALDGVKPS